MFAGLVAIGATVAIERLGGKLGGVLGSIPTTIVPASLGILAASADTVAFQHAMAAVPGGMAVDAVFLWTWRWLPPRLPPGSLGARLAGMVTLSLAAWLGAGAVLLFGLGAAEGAGLPPLRVGAALLLGLLSAGIAACWHPPPAPKGQRSVGPVLLAARGVFAGLAIAVCIVIAGTGASLAAGLASVFPAIFLTTMVSLWSQQGEAVPVGASGPMILGSTSVGVYALIAAITMPEHGPWMGASIAWVVSVVSISIPAAGFLTLRRGEAGAD